MSKEHIISNSILLPTIKVKGFSWCKREVKEISSSSIVSKILCKKHNNLLSPYDSEIKRFIEVFDEYFKVEKRINKYGFSVNKLPYKYQINGALVEKWFVKTLINVFKVKYITHKTTASKRLFKFL